MEWKDVIAASSTGTGARLWDPYGRAYRDPEPKRRLWCWLRPGNWRSRPGVSCDLCELSEGATAPPLRRGPYRQADQSCSKRTPQMPVWLPRTADGPCGALSGWTRWRPWCLDEADRMLGAAAFCPGCDPGFRTKSSTAEIRDVPSPPSRGRGHGYLVPYQRSRGDYRAPCGGLKPDIALGHRLTWTGRARKVETIAALIENGGYERAIAFCNTKNCRPTGYRLEDAGISCEAIHGDIMQRIREKTLEKFKRGEIRVLVATDGGPGTGHRRVDAVFNYDVPDELENYTTARPYRWPGNTAWPIPCYQRHGGHPHGRHYPQYQGRGPEAEYDERSRLPHTGGREPEVSGYVI